MVFGKLSAMSAVIRLDRLYTVDCGVDLADLDVDKFREYYLQIGGTDWEIVVKEENHAENLVQLQAF